MVMMVKQTCRHHRSTQWASARGLQQQQRQEGGRPRWLAVGPTLWAHSWMSRCVWDQGLQVIQYMPTWQSSVSLACVARACMCGTPGCMHAEGLKTVRHVCRDQQGMQLVAYSDDEVFQTG
jgi:hypothetical protein